MTTEEEKLQEIRTRLENEILNRLLHTSLFCPDIRDLASAYAILEQSYTNKTIQESARSFDDLLFGGYGNLEEDDSEIRS